jgi:hypothetical protein
LRAAVNFEALVFASHIIDPSQFLSTATTIFDYKHAIAINAKRITMIYLVQSQTSIPNHHIIQKSQEHCKVYRFHFRM